MTNTAGDLMSRGVECVQAHETLDRAAQLMREHGVGALPVCLDDRVTGIITDRDIVVECVALGHDPARVRAGDLATGLVWVPAEATVEEALARMEEHQIKRLPVMRGNRVIGMISEADLARHLPEHQLAEFVQRVYATS
ncbi:MAG TPA: CBS domain-containing protein [Nonomuraea sp.]|uniref:CBS domain-containing protein n=1 Tax=Nonomuraea sp. NPDC049649 TaxID=3155776 RepID=UPI002C478B2B|nr:CBS domain-containing protein [Nonomuraea sp.]